MTRRPLSQPVAPRRRSILVISFTVSLCFNSACGWPTLEDDVLLGWYFTGHSSLVDTTTGHRYGCSWEFLIEHIDSLFTTWDRYLNIEVSTSIDEGGGSGQSSRNDLLRHPIELERNKDSLLLRSETLGSLVAFRDSVLYPQPVYTGEWQCPTTFWDVVEQLEPDEGGWIAHPWTGDP